MIEFSETELSKLIIHKIGRHSEDGGVAMSIKQTDIDETTNQVLLNFFLKSFNMENYYRFFHEIGLEHNDVYQCVSKIFETKNFISSSQDLARLLYEQSSHPKIKAGEFYVVFFKNCVLNDEIVDAVGLFKTENKSNFLKVNKVDENFRLNNQIGISTDEIDKACIIFNTEKENGYIVQIIDNTSNNDAKYWKDNFLKVKQISNDYFLTQTHITNFNNFIKSEDKNICSQTKIRLKQNAYKYLTQNTNFNSTDFDAKVFPNDDIATAYDEYAKENDLPIKQDFEISEIAVKKSKRQFKNVLKLDKNFHVYVHGNRNLLEKGYDETKNKSYYKLYFDAEK